MKSGIASQHHRSLHLRIFCFGLLQNGDVGVGVSPEREEILIGPLGFGIVALQGMGVHHPL